MRALIAGLALCALPVAAPAAVVLEDDFNDGDYSDWTLEAVTLAPGLTTQVAGASSPAIDGLALELSLLKTPGTGDNIGPVFRLMRVFEVTDAVEHFFSVFAGNTVCSGCTVSYDVTIDGVLMTRAQDASPFTEAAFSLGVLGAGTHTVGLGVYSTNVSSGKFAAYFDDLSVTNAIASDVPLPAAAPLLAVGALALAGLGRRKG
ncbi:hypothetical protein ACQ5SO_18450 [Rhodovulum sp. DZ06]|uniref:hypothetical protein n=1 Tax=Rhodovulum sp. DZ06 TaxID=3425126 RepID=UPI003D343B51